MHLLTNVLISNTCLITQKYGNMVGTVVKNYLFVILGKSMSLSQVCMQYNVIYMTFHEKAKHTALMDNAGTHISMSIYMG